MEFIAISMAIIDISDMPIAVLKAFLNVICFVKTIVSSNMDETNPLIIANNIIEIVGQEIPEN